MNADSGVLGLPAGTKESGTRVDFNTDDFAIVIETKGYRVAWSRACLCPCKPVNDQTQQPDPNCTLCKGVGWIYFAPSQATYDPLKVGELDEVQSRIVQDNGAVVAAIMTGIGQQNEPYGELGSRISGTMMATVRSQNKIGYYDRLIQLDSVVPFSQILDLSSDLEEPLETRYPIVQVNLIRTATKTFSAPADFDLGTGADAGKIIWNTASANLPDVENPVAIHYLCHPTWLVIEHPHSIRMTPVTQKVKKPPTPAGEYVDLPIQAQVQLEFLPSIA